MSLTLYLSAVNACPKIDEPNMKRELKEGSNVADMHHIHLAANHLT
jgi:hypothetical protein